MSFKLKSILTQKHINVSIIPFSSKVLSANDTHVLIAEKFCMNDGTVLNYEKDKLDDYSCILTIKREDFMEMITLWLNEKADYYKRFGYFCGYFGNFTIEKIEFIGNKILTGDETEQEVPIFEVLEFSRLCDMEHG